MATVTVRSYRGGDELGIVTCWNICCPRDAITLNTFVQHVLCDDNFHPAYVRVAEYDGHIVGFLIGMGQTTPSAEVQEPNKTGWITAFAVHPAYRRRGIASALFSQLCKSLQTAGHTAIRFADYTPHYFLPGLDEQAYPQAVHFLSQHGFAKTTACVAMARRLADYTPPHDVLQLEKQRRGQGYRWQHLSVSRITALLTFAHKHFGTDWQRILRRAIQRGINFNQFLLAIDPRNRIVGFTLYGGADHRPGRFGPFGVEPSQRGFGIGKILLHRTLAAMRNKGRRRAWFLWTAEQTPAFFLYKQAGFHITRRFSMMQKDTACF